ncbi:MAG: hypothetical protein CVT80_12700 [Alphaproteobacteria bacterium HGW-Alphaproteobacteria-2]|nr:MAG: hypothetical protein CVT80_12700 [Alphaproteobacteria bacterium HGW-Alphaproteobacteria-2]
MLRGGVMRADSPDIVITPGFLAITNGAPGPRLHLLRGVTCPARDSGRAGRGAAERFDRIAA